MVMVSWDSKLGIGGPTRWKTPSPHVAMRWAIANWRCLFKCLQKALEEQLCPGRPHAGLGAPCCSPFTRDLLFGKNGWSCCAWALAGGSGPGRLPGLGVLGDLVPNSPVHHSLHAGDAALSNYIFQKWLLPQGFIRGFFKFNFPCKDMLAGPSVGDVGFLPARILSQTEERHFEDPFCHCQLLAAGGAVRAVVALPRSCFTHRSRSMPALVTLCCNFKHTRDLVGVTSG